jgi:putative ABC transport system permease protein
MQNLFLALKNLPRRGQHNLAKILCLGFGIAVSAILIGEVYFEQTFETWFPGHERVYHVNEVCVQKGELNEYSNTSLGVAQGIKELSPQVEAATCYTPVYDDVKVEVNNSKFRLEEIMLADSCLFQVFPCATIHGDLKEGLARPYYCVVSRSFAERIGGNVVGKQIAGKQIVGSKEYGFVFTIGGVYEDFPYSSSLHGKDMFISLSSVSKLPKWVGADRFASYVKLKPGAKIEDLKPNVQKMIALHAEYKEAEKAGIKFNYSFTQITEDHTSLEEVKTMSWIMTLLAIVLLVATVANYILIVMGNIVGRFREMAMRKCYGAGPRTIYSIMLSESLLHVLLSIVLAIALLVACKGKVEEMVSAPLSALLLGRGSWILLLLCVVITLIGGLVPGWLYNRIPVTAAFRGFHESRRRWKLVILSVEFMVVTVILCMLTAVQAQYRYLTHEDLGYDYDRLAIVTLDHLPTDQLGQAVNTLRTLPFVEGVSSCDNIPINGASGNNISLPGDDTQYFNIADQYSAADGYLKLMGMKVIEGRGFTEPADSNNNEVMVSRQFVSKFHTTTHIKGSVVGQRILVSEHSDKGKVFTICGVYEDVKIGSALYRDPRPSILFHSSDVRPNILVKFRELTVPNVETARKRLQRLFPDHDVSVTPYSMMISDAYHPTNSFRVGTLVTGITALIIALMGLIGYTNDEVNRRSKEIAIRKVNGATASDIRHLLVGDVLKLAIPAIVVGAVISYLVTAQWLQMFSDRIQLNPLMFVGVAIAIVVIIVVMLLFAAQKTINGNPVVYLKDE